MDVRMNRRDFFKVSSLLTAGSLLPACPDNGLVERARYLVDVSGRTLKVDLWIPNYEENNPLILFSHGYGGSPTSYNGLFRDFAENGYSVLAPFHDDYTNILGEEGLSGLVEGIQRLNKDIETVLEQVNQVPGYESIEKKDIIDLFFVEVLSGQTTSPELTEIFRNNFLYRLNDLSAVVDLGKRLAEGKYKGRIDIRKMGIAGHSLGGLATIEKLCEEDSRFKAGLLFSPVSQLSDVSKIDVPTMWMTGTLDDVNIRTTAKKSFEVLKTISYLIDWKYFGHMSFCPGGARAINNLSLIQNLGVFQNSTFLNQRQIDSCRHSLKKSRAITTSSLGFFNFYLKDRGDVSQFLEKYSGMIDEYIENLI